MSVYVGIDRHRKRSQVAVWNRDRSERCNRNVRNDSPELIELLGGLPVGTAWTTLSARLDGAVQTHRVPSPILCG